MKRHKNWKAREYGSFTRYERALNRMVAIVFYDPPGVYLIYGSPIEGGAVLKADQIISIASGNAFDLADYYIDHGKFPDNPEPR